MEDKHLASYTGNLLWSKEGFLENTFTVPTNDIEKTKIYQFFQEYGFVVINDVISQEEVKNTVDEIWQSPDLLGKKSLNREDPKTWTNVDWPGGLNQSKGFLPQDWNLQTLWDNRQNSRVYTCFQSVLGETKLQCSIDRIGMMRPTKGIKLVNGKTVNRPEWKTDKNWLHWDQNPWKEPNFVRVQGLVALSDFTTTSGGFHCVPGFNHFFEQWANKHIHLSSTGGLIEVPAKDDMRKYITKITMKSGSLLIWDSRLPHGNYPNNDNTFRITQYVTMYPAMDSAQATIALVLKNNLKSNVNFTDLGKKLFGLVQWPDEQ